LASNEIFDTAVIDSNFFISLVETGLEKVILPILQNQIPIECVMPYELPRSDIPTRFRDLRQMLINTEYVKGIKVDRDTKFWKWASELATKQHYIRAADDPADIDVVVLARLLEKHQNKRVAVISNDEGVVRTIREVTEFAGIAAMSAGSFLFTLSAVVEGEKLSTVLTEAGDKLYNQYLAYRNKTRKFIDIKSLVSELKETSVFVRKAASKQGSDHEAAYHSGKNAESLEISAPAPSMDEFTGIIAIIDAIRSYKDSYNLMGGEEYLYSIIPKINDLLSSVTTSDNFRMFISMLYGQIYEFRTWALELRLKTGGVYEALIHAENLLQLMIFLKVNKEIYEDVLALQSLLMLLNGRKQQALAIAKQIPVEEEMSVAQLMAILCTYIAQDYDDGEIMADKLMVKYIFEDKIIDATGFIDSVLRFSNTTFIFGNTDLAIKLNSFLLRTTGNKEPELVNGVAYRLFILTRINPKILDPSIEKIIKKILMKEQLIDNSGTKIPATYKKIQLSDANEGPFHGDVIIMQITKPIDKPTEFHVIGFEENSRSVWRFIFERDYSASLAEAMGFRLKGGEIEKLYARTTTDPENLRGTLVINNPAIQVDMQVHW
jgi:hypothetical protein